MSETPVHHPHHGIDYIEIYVAEMAASQRFYHSAFGWKFNDYSPGYAAIQKEGGGESGGLCVADSVAKGGPLVVLYSRDLATTVKQVEAAGGKITKPPFEFPGGRRFHFADPSGNELAVWSEA